MTRDLASLSGSRDDAIRLIGGLVRAVRVAPLWSNHVHAIAIYPTTLKGLVKIGHELTDGCKKRKLASDDEQLDFWNFFPGARRLLGCGSASRLHAFIRTDGITASVNVRKHSDGSSSDRSDNASDPLLDCGAKHPCPGQRLVAVDPGRRDMITAVTVEGSQRPIAVADEKFQRSISVSTKQYRRNARTSAAARVTRQAYDRPPQQLQTRLVLNSSISVTSAPCTFARRCLSRP